jgi:hypothetical protein
LAKNDLTFRLDDGGGAYAVPVELNPNDEWDTLILAEAQLLCSWTRRPARLLHCNFGTAAAPDGTIYVDKAQLDQLFGTFAGEKYKTALFFALAHEFGHLCQFAHFGAEETLNRPRVIVEAHADYLSGSWLGLRLVQGQERLSEDLLAAGLRLKADCDDYPTAYQRGALVQDAAGTSVTLAHILEPQIRDCDYTRLESGLQDQDIQDLYEIASRRLTEIPASQPERLSRPYTGVVRRSPA